VKEFFQKNEGIVRDGLVALKKCEPTDVAFRYDNDFTVNVNVNVKGRYAGRFYAQQLPGCCGVAIVYDMGSNERGLGRLLLDWLEKSVRAAGYAMLLGTTNNEQERMNNILPLRGWVRHKRFVNARTENECYVWSKRLMTSDEAHGFYERDEYGDIVEEDEVPIGV